MKKIFLSALLFVMLISMSFESGYSADCPSGYVNASASATIGGCVYNLDFCVSCITGQSVRLHGFNKVDPSCSSTFKAAEIIAYVRDNFSDPDWIRNNLFSSCSISQIPPCDEYNTGLEIHWVEDICWYKKNENGIIKYIPCITNGETNVYCSTYWRWCYDYQLGVKRKWIQAGPSISDFPNTVCPLLESQVPDPPLGLSSNCFQVPTLCSPY